MISAGEGAGMTAGALAGNQHGSAVVGMAVALSLEFLAVLVVLDLWDALR